MESIDGWNSRLEAPPSPILTEPALIGRRAAGNREDEVHGREGRA